LGEIWFAGAASYAVDDNVKVETGSRISIWRWLFSETGNSNISAAD